MELNVTDENVKKMAAEAINASKAVGMGWLHYSPTHHITPDEIAIVEGRISIDYFAGRMVKFHARKVSDGVWVFPDSISPDYQSWCDKYPTWELLQQATNI